METRNKDACIQTLLLVSVEAIKDGRLLIAWTIL